MKFKSYSFKELLSNIVDNRGKTCPVGDAGLPLIATNCIKEHSLYPVFEKVRYVSDETYTNWFRGHPQPGDMIFVCKGSPGRVNWVPDPVNFCIAQDMVAIRADTTKVYPKYLFALLRSQASQQKILNMHVGSLIPHFKKGDFGNLYFELPEDLEYQKKVGDAYFDFCLKIESNNQLNQTLEEMAQAIFKSWFVDFEPVKAKMNGEQPEGMDAATASLFPDKLVESELGLIPEGWDIATIKDFGSVVCGKTPSKKNADFYGGDVPFIKIPDTHGKVFITETTDTLTQAGDESQPKKRIPENSICVSCIATVGQVFITTKPSHTNQQINSVVPHDANSLYYLLFKFKGLNKHFHDLASGGSATLNMNTRTFSNVELVRPTADVMEAFHNTIGGLMQKMLTNQLENATLAELRDTLLPKLLSGEIELDVEKVNTND
ncbi:TPA: restriction endonuclease subunit S [Vibrio alginolyticus]